MKIRMVFGLVVFFIGIPFVANLFGKTYSVMSPDKKIELKIQTEKQLTYSVFYKGELLLKPSALSMTVEPGGTLGLKAKVKKAERQKINRQIKPVVAQKNAVIADECNELRLHFKKNFTLVFRVYNDGVAYRFITKRKGEMTVTAEQATFNFTVDHAIYFPEEESFFTHQERQYLHLLLSEISSDRMSSIPALIEVKQGPKVLITEADLQDYPGFFLSGSDESPAGLKAVFPHYPLKTEQTNDRNVPVRKYAPYLAKTAGNRSFPWRVLLIAEKDGDLIASELVYKLAPELQLKDVSWILPGKVSWDWWNNWQIYGVDFKAGINTKTYKYYIDFAAKYGIEYIILDEGWSDPADLFKINPDLNMKELLQYANRKNVGIILWCVWITLDKQLRPALDQFERWGIKGIKVDFMQRDDQELVNYYWMIAREAAKRHLLVDFHGAYKPAGLRRAYPNVITREGVLGLEHNKWSLNETPEHDLMLPFTRMVAGPMDFTPGAMINAQKENFRPVYNKPMSQGTRCHQLAMYVVFESPLQMLADSPSNYLREPEIMTFLEKVPTVWDETKVIDAKVSDYVLLVRRHGDEWFIGAMTDWTPRELKLDFSFLPQGEYRIELFQDGVNANRYAGDYKKVSKKITNREQIKIKLAPGGGWVGRIYK